MTNFVLYKGERSVDGSAHGEGEGKYANGDVYHGNWVKGLRHGQGSITYANGSHYEGEWVEDRRAGTGKLWYSQGNANDFKVYEGAFADNLPEGDG
jgi:hypothetical protein